MKILFTLLILATVFYAIQLFVIAIMFYGDDYKYKKDLYRDLTPFYWLLLLYRYIRDSTIEKWNDLDVLQKSDDDNE